MDELVLTPCCAAYTTFDDYGQICKSCYQDISPLFLLPLSMRGKIEELLDEGRDVTEFFANVVWRTA